MTQPAVSVRGLTKTCSGEPVVDGLPFDVPRGVVADFVGPNGAGKTTTMAMLLGLVRPTAGSGTVLGAPLARPAAYLSRVGATIEAPTLWPGLTGRENLCPRLPGAPFATVVMSPATSLLVRTSTGATYLGVGCTSGPVVIALGPATVVAAASTPCSRKPAVMLPGVAIPTPPAGPLLAGIPWFGAPWAVGLLTRAVRGPQPDPPRGGRPRRRRRGRQGLMGPIHGVPERLRIAAEGPAPSVPRRIASCRRL